MFESFSRDCFDQKKRSGAQREKRKVVRQVYRVKKDGRKDASTDLNSNEEKPIKMLESSAAKGKDTRRSTSDSCNAKSGQKKLEVSKAEEDLPLFASTSHPRCQLGLSRWQKQKLQKLSTQELKERNLAWVPKRDAQVQHKGDVSAFIGKRATKVNNRRRFKNKPLDQRFAPNHQNLWSLHHLYYSYVPSTDMLWSPFPGVCCYPSWSCFDPWSYQSDFHGWSDAHLFHT